MIKLGGMGICHKATASGAAGTFTQSGPYQRFNVSASIDIHIATSTAAKAAALAAADTPFAATNGDFLLLQGNYVEVLILEGGVLSYIANDSESTGDIFIQPVSQTL